MPAVLITAVLSGAVMVVDGYPDFGPSPLGLGSWFWLGFSGAVALGGVPALLYGAPIYAYYLGRRMPFWTLLVASTLPGFVLALVEIGLGVFFAFGGLVFLLVLHGLVRCWPSIREGRANLPSRSA